ncbi:MULTISPECIES: beta-ketoacyl-ACP synthase III [unclassified Kitasatospora]|uniref:beta-ketoacyl-ACP synthase III n=1 Tax=unclassified Kitasatospora TaxID=2633591 RepID=UPI00070A92D9|nr:MULTISPECIES: beta-ketoacyl-ACP synthase III [unclassified Kitasatospora]KQV18575.1 3-oxoacyl-ACP synthase [Kitasatospora sp. Root107]KRB74557.1 3-oxoacyl-ACP synthase [Kitasatospora sp. Root187]
MTASRIVSLGHFQPPKVLTNDDLALLVDTDDEWIRSRVGIRSRHLAEDETLVDMATEAAQKALANSGLLPEQIDLVVVATCTAVERSPNTAAAVSARLGIRSPAAYDINTVCSGFSYALATADHAIRAGSATRALVIGAERMSDTIDWSDRTTAVIFADGAGAAVVEAVPDEQSGIGPVLWGSEPDKGDAVVITGWDPTISQQGQTVFRWATTQLAPLARETCRKAGIEPSELRGFVAHQANLRIIDAIANKLGLAEDAVVARDVVESGNTSAASIPLALSKLVERGELRTGDPVLLFGFGGGLAYAGQVVRCP